MTIDLGSGEMEGRMGDPRFRNEPANIELSRVIIRHRSSRVTVTRQFSAVQVFFHVNHRRRKLNTRCRKSRKPYSFVDLADKLCYPLSSFWPMCSPETEGIK